MRYFRVKIAELTADSHISYFDFKDDQHALAFANLAYVSQICINVSIHIVDNSDDMPEWRTNEV